MTVIVTRDVPDRIRGFLASVLLEIAPGVYTAPRMTQAVRDRVWAVVTDWFGAGDGGSVVMTWVDRKQAGGQQVRTLGVPAKELVELDGVYLTRRDQKV